MLHLHKNSNIKSGDLGCNDLLVPGNAVVVCGIFMVFNVFSLWVSAVISVMETLVDKIPLSLPIRL